ERRELRAQLSVRSALVETRGQYITTIRGLARAVGVLLPTCQPQKFTRRFAQATLGDVPRRLVEPLTQTVITIEAQLAQVEQILSEMAQRDPIVGLLATAPGVGLIVAATFVSVLDEAKRFRNAHAVGAYLGLVPGESTTGGPTKRRLGSITKQGNTMARAMLIQSAWLILRSRDVDDPLRRWGTAIAENRGKSIAALALARTLSGVLWGMWRDGTVYDRTTHATDAARGAKRVAREQAHRADALVRSANKLRRRDAGHKMSEAAMT